MMYIIGKEMFFTANINTLHPHIAYTGDEI